MVVFFLVLFEVLDFKLHVSITFTLQRYILSGMVTISVKIYFSDLIIYNTLKMYSYRSNEILESFVEL